MLYFVFENIFNLKYFNTFIFYLKSYSCFIGGASVIEEEPLWVMG